jgi:hypothetical protein
VTNDDDDDDEDDDDADFDKGIYFFLSPVSMY